MPVATSIAGGLEKPDLAIPKGALVMVVSKAKPMGLSSTSATRQNSGSV